MDQFDILLIFITLLFGLNKIWQKKISKYFEADTFTYLIQVISVIVILPILILFNSFKFEFNSLNIILVFIAGISWYIGSLITNRSIKATDLTLREPILQTRTIFVILLAAIFLKEDISIFEYIGGLTIFIGSIISSLKEKVDYANFKKDGLFLSFMSAFLIAVSYTFDKYALNFIDVLSWTFLMYLVPLIFLLPKTNKVLSDIKKQSKINLLTIFIVILVSGIAYIGLLYVISKTNLSRSFPLSQLSFVIVFLGGLYLGERKNLSHRIMGSIIAIIGGVIIFLN